VVSGALLFGADRSEQREERLATEGGEISPGASQEKKPPRFTWSPPHGYVFVEGSCGTDDQTLGWMAPVGPKTLREAKLIMFSHGESWRTQFAETSGHFVERWMKLKGKEVVVVPGDPGRPKNAAVGVRVLRMTPYEEGTLEEAMYLQGYAGGYMDFVNLSPWSSAPIGGPRGEGWAVGWVAAKRASGSYSP